jgi:hypothetical protein
VRVGLAAGGVLLVAACAPVRTTPETRYLGILLDARDLGEGEVRREAERDPAIARYHARARPTSCSSRARPTWS